MTANIDPDTGIRYGVISGNTLDGDILSKMMISGTNLTYEHAYEDEKKDLESSLADPEALDYVVDPDDREACVEKRLERWSENWEADECTYEGVYETIKYRISWLGGAPLVWALGPLMGWAERLCSPCVPGAADLDGGYTVDDGPTAEGGGFKCYVVPKGWLMEES